MKRTVIILLSLTILLSGCVSSQLTPTDPALNDPSTPSQTYAYDPDAKPTKSTAPSTEPATQPNRQNPHWAAHRFLPISYRNTVKS